MTRLKTYRLDEDMDRAFVAAAASRGETVTAVLTRAIEAYIRESADAPVYTRPVAEAPVYTPETVEAPPVYTPPEPAKPRARRRKSSARRQPPPSPRMPEPSELDDEPRRVSCRHPSEAIDDLGVCHGCGTELD